MATSVFTTAVWTIEDIKMAPKINHLISGNFGYRGLSSSLRSPKYFALRKARERNDRRHKLRIYPPNLTKSEFRIELSELPFR